MIVFREDDEAIQAVTSMPNVFRYGMNKLIPALSELVTKGLKSILIFGIVETLPKVFKIIIIILFCHLSFYSPLAA